jgi:trans-aconitate methyltransferase
MIFNRCYFKLKEEFQLYKWDAVDYEKNSSAQQKWARELIKKLKLNVNEYILDIGCGDGKVTSEIASILNNGHVLGIDSSKDMIELAQKTFPEDKNKNLNFKLKDVQDLDFKEQFDVVFSNAALHWIHEHLPVLKKINRSLKPSGKILIQMGGKGNAQDILEIADEMIKTDYWKKYLEDFDFKYGFFGKEQYTDWLIEAGFNVKRVELINKIMTKYGKDELEAWIRKTWLPYIQRVSSNLQSKFIDELASKYIEMNGEDNNGEIHLKMVRLEVEAIK